MVSHNFPQSMETGNDQHQRHNFTQRGVSGICGVPARLSGMVSLAVQTVVLVISCLLVAVLFVHSGGYKYFQKNGTGVASESFLAFGPNDGIENGTNFPHLENIPAPMAILSSTENNETNIEGGGDNSTELLLNLEGMGEGELLNGTTTILDGNNVSSTTIARQIDAAINQENQTLNMDELEMIGNSILEEEEMQSTNSGNETYGINGITGGNSTTIHELKRNQTSSFDGPFEQIHPILLRIGRNAELDLLAMLRALCILYGCACLLWFISLIGLLISLKLEIVDLVYVNTFLLAVVTVLLFINSIAGAVLILYQTEYNWKMLVTICCIESGFVLCLLFNILAITFLIIWYRYIDYMSGGDESCICLSTLVGCIKGRARGGEDGGGGRRQQAEANYTIPEATRHSQLPYIDDPPVQQFSNF